MPVADYDAIGAARLPTFRKSDPVGRIPAHHFPGGGIGTFSNPALRVMMVSMRQAESPEPDSHADGPQDIAVTVNPPLFFPAALIGRERALGELPSLLREGKRLVTLAGIRRFGKTRLVLEPGFSASRSAAPATAR